MSDRTEHIVDQKDDIRDNDTYSLDGAEVLFVEVKQTSNDYLNKIPLQLLT